MGLKDTGLNCEASGGGSSLTRGTENDQAAVYRRGLCPAAASHLLYSWDQSRLPSTPSPQSHYVGRAIYFIRGRDEAPEILGCILELIKNRVRTHPSA